MALSIKTTLADELARELAAATQESLTDAVTTALRERLQRVRERTTVDVTIRLDRLAVEYTRHTVGDPRPAEQILGYDAAGLPR